MLTGIIRENKRLLVFSDFGVVHVASLLYDLQVMASSKMTF